MKTFTEHFDAYVCEGDSIECIVNGVTYTAYVKSDSNYSIDDDDVHSTDQSVTGCSNQKFKDLMNARQAWQNGEWFYCGVVLKAKRDGWEKDNLADLWGLEVNYPNSDNNYLKVVAEELLQEYLEELS